MSINAGSPKYLRYYLALTILLSVILCNYQVNNINADNKTARIANFKIQIPATVAYFPTDALKVRELSPQLVISEPQPAAIPMGTTLDKVSFVGIDLTSNVMAIADTNEDRIPDSVEEFLASDDPINETTAAMAINRRTGRFYLGVVAADGPNKQQGEILIANNADGNFRGKRLGKFSIGKGTPVGMVVIDSPAGDILIVAKLFFADKVLGVTSTDSYTITAYLPGSNGTPDGVKTVPIVPEGAKLGDNPLNFGFGGLALDNRGNLYANVASKVMQDSAVQLIGGIVLFSDSNNDNIPETPVLFAIATPTDPVPLTASSIVPLSDNRIVVYGVNDIIRRPNQIAIYTDSDKNLMADGPATNFYTSPSQFQGSIGSFGDGSSAVEISHMDFSNGQAFFAFTSFDITGSNVLDAGVAAVKDQGDGKGGPATKIFSAPKVAESFTGITFVTGVPRPSDTTAPTIKINLPTVGQTLLGGTMATVSFTSSDNVSVLSHNIALAVDGSNFNITVANSLPGATQSFQFTVPQINSSNAALRVQAIDDSGNVTSDMVGMLTIVSDTTAPTVSVISPKTKDKLKGNTSFTVTFTSSDNIAVDSHSIEFSSDGGASFMPLASGIPGSVQSFDVTVPNSKVKMGVVRVTARDAAGNVGTGLSGVFKVKPSKRRA